ncbi:MAG TPA: hypothetical protein VFE32_17330 [Puia sp.]|jgi:hypothetical protein|nr:hypothetical protein [Puia sp.]
MNISYGGLPSIGIIVTWGRDMIIQKGGLLAFIRYFELTMADEEGIWMQKSKNCPQQDVAQVYVIVCNKVRYRLFYAGYQTGATAAFNGNGHSWSSRSIITWPRILMAGPFEKAPRKIPMRGFQGFRYVYEPIW